MSKTSKPTISPDIWVCSECGSLDLVFDRTLCACGAMHYYCGSCGVQDDDCDPIFHDACGCDLCHPEIHNPAVWS